jgi:hypothetical protein
MNDPRNYREEAARIRAVAAAMEGEAKVRLLEIARLYDGLADKVENPSGRPVARDR